MTVNPTASAWAKYHWASKHMERVYRAIERSLEPHGEAITFNGEIKPEGNRATCLIRIASLAELHFNCGLALGDVFQNFRAALNHLAWGLVEIGSKPQPPNPEQICFPMARSGEHFSKTINRWLPGVPPEYRAVIRRYQPYCRGDGPKAMRWLQKFSNKDKHRVLVPMVLNQSQINVNVSSSWPIARMDWLVRKPRALHVGTPVLRLSLHRVSPDCHMEVKSEVALFPSLGYGVPLDEALTLVRATVLDVLGTIDEML
jgi:hypothetical protein